MQKSSIKSPRGRPKADGGRDVPKALLKAAQTVMRRPSESKVTAREIADVAGTTEAMVNYYFGSKSAFWFEAWLNERSDFEARSTKILEDCKATKSVTPLMSVIFDYAYRHPYIVSVLIGELRNGNLRAKEAWLKKYIEGKNVKFIRMVIQDLRASGVIREDIDDLMAMTVSMSLIIWPLFMHNCAPESYRKALLCSDKDYRPVFIDIMNRFLLRDTSKL